MTKEQKDWQASLKLAKEALTKIDKVKYPKRYKIQEELVDTLQYNDNMRARAEKAEKAAKATEPVKVKETPIKPAEKGTPEIPNYSLQDIRALNTVHDDDIERVEKFAKGEEITISEALKNEDLKAILKNREEQRKTAEATNTGGGKRGTSSSTGKELLKSFRKTKDLPESDEEIRKLAEAELKEKETESR